MKKWKKCDNELSKVQFSVTVYKTVTSKIGRRGQTFFFRTRLFFFLTFFELSPTPTRAHSSSNTAVAIRTARVIIIHRRQAAAVAKIQIFPSRYFFAFGSYKSVVRVPCAIRVTSRMESSSSSSPLPPSVPGSCG